MVMAATKSWTREDVLALPDDGKRYELVDGELLVSPGLVVGTSVGCLSWPCCCSRSFAPIGLGALMALPGDLDLTVAESGPARRFRRGDGGWSGAGGVG